MLRKERTKAYLLSLAAAVLLMSNVYVGRAEEESFEIVWQKDIGLGIEYYPFKQNYLKFNDNQYAFSDKMKNFVVYRDSLNSFTVLKLTTGEFIKKIITEVEIWNMDLLNNNSRLIVFGSNNKYYIYNTENWELERSVPTDHGFPGFLTEDLNILAYCTEMITLYDFNTMKFISEFKIDKILQNAPMNKIIFSKDLQKILIVSWCSSGDPLGDNHIFATLIQVYDMLTKKLIFRLQYDDWLYSIINDDLSNLFVINSNTHKIDNYDFNNNGFKNEIPCGRINPPLKLSKNKRFIYSGGDSWININPVNYGYDSYSSNNVGTFADVGEDYIIAWKSVVENNYHNNYLIKLNINDQNLVPVNDVLRETEILYPNPVNAIVHISNVHLQNINEIKVIDEKGTDFSEICTVSLLPDGIDLNLQKLNTGVYFIRVGNSEFSKTYKVIKC